MVEEFKQATEDTQKQKEVIDVGKELLEIKTELKRSNKKAYAIGVYLAGVSMMAVGFANFIAATPREYFSAPVYTMVLGAVLCVIGLQFMKKAKG